MRSLLLAVLVCVAGCSKKEEAGGGGGGSSSAANSGDLQEYTRKLKEKTPYDVKAFTEKGMKAESYVKDEQYGHFKEVVIQVDPVYLTDKITGKATRYTRAKLIRNNPKPLKLNKSGGAASFPEPFEWASVEMLP